MKKLVLILGVLLFAQASFAYLEEYTTSDNKTLQGVGFSQETLRIIDTARMNAQGVEKDYVPYYEKNFYSKNFFLKWYQAAKVYVDPAAEDHVFGVREIVFENSPMDIGPTYVSRKTPNDKYNRLYENDIKRLEVAGKRVKNSNGIERPIYTNTDKLFQENL